MSRSRRHRRALGCVTDQLLPDPCDPTLHESYVVEARVLRAVAACYRFFSYGDATLLHRA